MTTKLEDAAARYRRDPGKIFRIREDARQIATVVARRHPAGYAAIYAEVERGIQAAGFLPVGPEQLLAMEAVHVAVVQRQEEADAEVARQRQAHDEMASQSRLELMAGGCISRAPRDAALQEAITAAKLHLDNASPRLGDGSETNFQALLDDVENATKALMATVGLARRSSKARARAEAAAAAVAAAKAAKPDIDPPTDLAA